MVPTLQRYRDYANVVEGTELSDSSEGSEPGNSNNASCEQNFPVKLHYMLSDMESDGLQHIVSWQAHGRSFTVNKPKEFGQLILPLWFRQSKFSSFQRQLNLYGFKRITSGPDKGSYYHELFLRGKRFLSHRIKRCKIKGTGARKPSAPEQEPNFYTKPYLPPSLSPMTTSATTSLPNPVLGMAGLANANSPTVQQSTIQMGVAEKSPVRNSNNNNPMSGLLAAANLGTSSLPPLSHRAPGVDGGTDAERLGLMMMDYLGPTASASLLASTLLQSGIRNDSASSLHSLAMLLHERNLSQQQQRSQLATPLPRGNLLAGNPDLLLGPSRFPNNKSLGVPSVSSSSLEDSNNSPVNVKASPGLVTTDPVKTLSELAKKRDRKPEPPSATTAALLAAQREKVHRLLVQDFLQKQLQQQTTR